MFNTNIFKLFLKYTVPSVASMIGISLYILADTFFIANGVGSQGLTALNIVLPVYSLIHGTGLLISIGGATVYSIARAANKSYAKEVFSFTLFLSCLAALILTVAGVFFAEELVLLLGASDQVLEMSSGYLRILSMFSAFFLLNNLLMAFIRNDSAPSLAMYAMLAGTFVNTVLDYIFIYEFGWGMQGAALATGSGPVLGIIILSYHFLAKKNSFTVSRFTLKNAPIGQILRGGSSSFIVELSTGVVILAFNIALLRAIGDIGVAAYGIIANIALVCTAIFTGIGQGMQPIISSNYGAGLIDRCKKTLLIGITTTLGLGVLFYALGIFYPQEITRVFNLANDQELTNITVIGIRIYFIGFLFSGVNIVISSYFQAILSSQASLGISLTRGLFAIMIGLAILPNLFGVEGIWTTIPFAEFTAFALAMVYTRKHFKQFSTLPQSAYAKGQG